MPSRPHAATVVLAGVLAIMIGIGAAPAAGTGSKPGAPSGDAVTRLLDVPFADPGYFVEGRDRYIYATGYSTEDGFTAFRVAKYDESTGRYGKPRASMVTRPRWVGPRGGRHARGALHMWGPHVWKRSVPGPRDYVMYFSASRRGHADCLGMAVATSPMGPFVPRPYPLRCGTRGSTMIDPAHFVSPAGRHFVLFKRKRFHPRDVGIWGLAVKPNGTLRRHARPFRLVDGGGHGIEAPSAVTRGGRTYLFTSRRRFDSCAYRTVVYVSGHVDRPFRWLSTLGLRRPDGRRFCGPGGAEVRKVGGGFRMVFHAFDANPRVVPGADRYAWGVPLRWSRTGRPYAAPAPPPTSRFVPPPSATVSSSTKSGSSRRSPYKSLNWLIL